MTAPDSGMAVSASLLRPAGFEYRQMDVEDVTINYAIAGTGPPLLLLHGYPQNHLMWRHVAPVLAEGHTVVLADLRGYGDSGKPSPDAADLVYAKRSMAHDQAGLMRQLGWVGAGGCRQLRLAAVTASRASPSRRALLPGCACDVGGDDVGGGPVQAAAGPLWRIVVREFRMKAASCMSRSGTRHQNWRR